MLGTAVNRRTGDPPAGNTGYFTPNVVDEKELETKEFQEKL